MRRRLELKGSRGGVRIYDDYAHHPTEVRAALSALRELEPSRLIAVFQPHLYSRTKALGEEFGAALALADEVVVLDVYPAREEPVGELAGVSGLRVARGGGRADGRQAGLVAAAGGDRRERALAERLDAAIAATARSWSRSAPATSSSSARRWSRAARMSAPPAGVEPDFPLARLTTVRTGGAADWFARPATPRRWSRCCAGPRQRGWR